MPSPITVATLQAAVLSTISNVLAQMLSAYRETRPFALDIFQLLRFTALALFTAPPNYQWQAYLERTFPAYPSAGATAPKRRTSDVEHAEEKRKDEESQGAARPRLDWKNTMTKWFVDCITLGALVNTVAFLVLMGIMKGQAGAQIAQNVRTETMPIIVMGYKIWPIASIISFTCVPVERRIIFLSFVGLLWNIYMSLVAARV